MRPLEVIILAAGQGTRMRSKLPKVLHTLAGKPLLAHVIDAAGDLSPRAIHVVVGHGAELVREAFDGQVNFIKQSEQRGTGHAVQIALPAVGSDANVLILFGDVPLVNPETLAACVLALDEASVAIVTADFDDPAQLGRITRNSAGHITGIVEYKDASEEERALREINSGILAAPAVNLSRLLGQINDDNAQGELYLTDVVSLAVAGGERVEGLKAAGPAEVLGVNDRSQLAEAERLLQERLASELMAAGTSLADPARIDIRGTLNVGQDCFIDVNVVFEGNVQLGDNVIVGPGCVIKDSTIGSGTTLAPYTLLEQARVAEDCSLGPFARLRPGTNLSDGVRIGNFVETKKTSMGVGSKANHLAYLGDATIGADCNVGAGTITCNYDGISKHPTHIGDGVFVGTNSTLVAPISIGDGAFIAAGSTVTTTVKSSSLAVGRARQRNIDGWTRPDQRAPADSKADK